MEFDCVGYTAERLVTRGKITADNENDAGGQLSRDGYQVLSLKKAAAPLLTTVMPSYFQGRVKQEEIVLFSRHRRCEEKEMSQRISDISPKKSPK